jgi:integrase/recombinase XerC
VRAPRVGRALPKALTPDEARQLLDRTADGALERRDKAMFELCYSSGLRLAELVGLDAADARSILRDNEVTVTGKGRKTRAVPVGAKAIAALREWVAARAEVAGPAEPALFVGARGERVNPAVVRKRLARWALRAGIGQHVHPHVLRHSFASHVLQSSSDLRAVQEMLGHASISTTQVYTHLDFQHLAKVYDAAHPRAKKKG